MRKWRIFILSLVALVILAFSSLRSHAQLVNGDFSAGAAGWTQTAPANSSLNFTGGQLIATGDNNGGANSSALATQTFTSDPGILTYLLVSYTSTDVADWDWPVISVNGTNFRVATGGNLIASTQNLAGSVTNGTGAANLSGITAIPGGTITVGPGVFSVDSIFGAGVATWDDIDFQELTLSPVAQTVLENNSLTLAGANAPQVATNTTETFTVILSVSNGVIALGSPGSVTITGGADNSATVTFTGTPTAINTAMDGLVYTPNTAFSGAETLVFTVTGTTDLVGTTTDISDTDNIPITVTPGTSTLTVTKVADLTTNVPAGQTITYTYVVTNTGDQVLTNITLSDSHGGSGPAPTPANENLTLDGGAPGGSSDGTPNNGIWDTLAPGDAVTFTGTYIVTQNDVDTLQ